MSFSAQEIKEKMLEFTRLFCIERNIFQRFVIVYKYIRFLNKDPLTKDILQKIFNDTAKVMGESDKRMDEDEFLDVKGEAIFTREFWNYYSNLEVIYGKMRKMKKCRICDGKEFEDLTRLFSKPYSKEMLELSLKVVNSNIFDKLDQETFLNGDQKYGETYFDADKSILHIKGKKIQINKQDKITNAHKILNHIFIRNKEDLKDDFYYAEIAEDEFNELEYKAKKDNWKRYHTACEEVNKKVKEQTNDEIKKFLLFNTGQKGKVKLNKKYL